MIFVKFGITKFSRAPSPCIESALWDCVVKPNHSIQPSNYIWHFFNRQCVTDEQIQFSTNLIWLLNVPRSVLLRLDLDAFASKVRPGENCLTSITDTI
jgi:hypothetical protein